jgi:hypothetical protein
MTSYKKIQSKARAMGIDTVQDNYCSPRGYWITQANGEPLWAEDNFAGSLGELQEMVECYEQSVN